MTTDKSTIYHRYEIEESKPGVWTTVWYDSADVFVYRSAPYSIRSVGENAAKFLFNKHSPLSTENVNTVEEKIMMVDPTKPANTLGIADRHHSYEIYRGHEQWFIRWFDADGKETRTSSMGYLTHASAVETANNFRGKFLAMDAKRKNSKVTYKEYSTWYISSAPDGKSVANIVDSNKKVVLSFGFNTFEGAHAFVKEKFNIKSEGSYPPRTHTPYNPPPIKTWNEKWLEGISRWFPEGVPEDLVQLLK